MRQVHVYLGCFFAPLLIYFSITGAWQLFRFNNLPKDHPPTVAQTFFHEFSKPHTDANLPGTQGKGQSSALFKIFSLLMALGFVATAVLGIQLGFQTSRRRRLVILCVIGGTILPVLLLFIRL